MQILRNEVRTGLLVLLTLGLVVGVVLYIASPGLFRPLKEFDVYFDDAAGIKPGAAVMLAGRKIGTVSSIQSPVPLNDRPENKPNYEAMVRVQVADDSQIYKETTVVMRTFGLLAELVIDFTNGNSESGLAQPGAKFVGTRAPDLGEVGPIIIQKLDPALKQSEATLAELQRTSHNLTTLTAPDAPLTRAFKSFEGVGSNLKGITDKGGKIDSAFSRLEELLSNLKGVTAQLQKDNNIEKAIANFRDASAEFERILDSLNKGVGRVLLKVGPILDDLKELSGKLKEQPWRIVWPSTIKYPGPEQSGGAPTHVSARRRGEQ
jgi:ABC-type transporter Mla subunit MlaD